MDANYLVITRGFVFLSSKIVMIAPEKTEKNNESSTFEIKLKIHILKKTFVYVKGSD